jgi:hypothetical protein
MRSNLLDIGPVPAMRDGLLSLFWDAVDAWLGALLD